MNTVNLFDVIIVGGGFSGTMVAASLTDNYKSERALRISVINCRYEFGRGIAYSTNASYNHLKEKKYLIAVLLQQ